MTNPYSVQIHCDGAMDYDSKQTGGNGFIIEFPDSFEVEPISRSIRNDGQGIHRLEMISLIEAMEELLQYGKKYPEQLRRAAGVELYTDRLRVTDGNLTGRYRIRDWRRNGWKNYEGKAVKDKDLLDKIDKTRIKLEQIVHGSVSINYEREKRNKVADKLSKAGKKTITRGRKIIEKKNRRVIKRLYEGPEINYLQLKSGDSISGRVYAWEPISNEFEVCLEISAGSLLGRVVKTSITPEQKADLQRGHFYKVTVKDVFKHHITVKKIREIKVK